MKKIFVLLSLLLVFCMTACDSESSNGDKIEMPHDSSYYYNAKWTEDSLEEHFEELGFENIRKVPCEPDDDRYTKNIFELVIETGMFSTDPWEEGDKFEEDAEITIYYNESPMLTVENCSDLLTVLTSNEIDYMAFMEEYDGRYVEFDAYVSDYITYDGGTSPIIDVIGDKDSDVCEFRIGDRDLDHIIDESVQEGDKVLVSGKLDADWAKYYKQLYVECLELRKK